MEKSQVELLLFFIEITLESRQMNSWKKWIHENEFMKKMIFRNYESSSDVKCLVHVYVENLKFMKKMSFRNSESSSDVKFLVYWKLKIHEKNEFFSRGAAPNPAGGLTVPPWTPSCKKIQTKAHEKTQEIN